MYRGKIQYCESEDSRSLFTKKDGTKGCHCGYHHPHNRFMFRMQVAQRILFFLGGAVHMIIVELYINKINNKYFYF